MFRIYFYLILIGISALPCCRNKQLQDNKTGTRDSLYAFFSYDTNPPLKTIYDSITTSGNISIHKLKLENDSTHLYYYFVYNKTQNKLSPVLLYQHWGEGDYTEFLDEAIEMSRTGYACVLVNAPWLKPECEDRSFMRNGFNLYKEGVMDWLKVTDHLFGKFPFLDTSHVTFVGHSYGGQIAGIMSGLDGRIKNVVIMAGTASTTRSLLESDDASIREWRDSLPDDFNTWISKMQPLDPERYLPHFKGNLLLQYARKDEFKIDSLRAMQVLKAVNAKEERFLYYDDTHKLDLPQVKADRIAWIKARYN